MSPPPPIIWHWRVSTEIKILLRLSSLESCVCICGKIDKQAIFCSDPFIFVVSTTPSPSTVSQREYTYHLPFNEKKNIFLCIDSAHSSWVSYPAPIPENMTDNWLSIYGMIAAHVKYCTDPIWYFSSYVHVTTLRVPVCSAATPSWQRVTSK